MQRPSLRDLTLTRALCHCCGISPSAAPTPLVLRAAFPPAASLALSFFFLPLSIFDLPFLFLFISYYLSRSFLPSFFLPLLTSPTETDKSLKPRRPRPPYIFVRQSDATATKIKSPASSTERFNKSRVILIGTRQMDSFDFSRLLTAQ